jgi:hypothetical protein
MSHTDPDAAPAAAANAAAPALASRRRAWLALLLVGAVVGLAHLLLISCYGSSAPFWDQWGAEGAAIYRPLLEGTYDWSHLFSAHNEHRIALVRVLAMALFWLNDGQWDARVQALANSAIFTTVLCLLAWYIARRLRPALALPLCLLLALAGALPYGWENTLIGFQSQFHFFYLFTFLLFWAAAHRRAGVATALLLGVLATGVLFTIASGLISLVAGLFVLGLRAWGRRDSLAQTGLLAAPLLLVLVVAVVTFPHLPGHSLKAQDAGEFLRALLLVLSWPSWWPVALLLLLAFGAFALQLLRRRSYDPVEGFFAGVFVWGLANAVSMAYARGHGLTLVTSRYTEMLAIAGIAGLYFALNLRSWLPRLPQRPHALLGGALVVLFGSGLALQSLREWPQMQERSMAMRIGAGNIRAYLEGNRQALENKPGFYILFPESRPLELTLDNGTIRSLLPLSLRLPGATAGLGKPTRCRWRADEPTLLPIPGHLDCAAAAGDASGVPLGRLTRVAYALWKMFNVGSALEMQPEPRRLASSDGRCSLDLVNLERVQVGQIVQLANMPAVRLTGWSVQPGKPPQGPLRISLVSPPGQSYGLSVTHRTQRLELGDIFKDPAQVDAGFDAHLATASLPVGRYSVMVGRDGEVACDTRVSLLVMGATDERMLY